jgi:hypothetical protein
VVAAEIVVVEAAEVIAAVEAVEVIVVVEVVPWAHQFLAHNDSNGHVIPSLLSSQATPATLSMC